MKKYDNYKESGIEWLGKIPENWKVVKIKHVLSNLNSRRIPLSSVERAEMKEHQYDYYGASGVIDKVDNYLFDEETILIGEDGANLLSRSKRLAFIASGKYWVNNHAHILKPIDGSIRYFAELLETIDYTPLIVGAAQPKLTQEALMNVEVIKPPMNEQYTIASYLDHKTIQIDTLIEKKEKLIEKLKLQRQAIINEAVTKGLNPDAPMKDSGIEWLGKIPEHWKLKKLKYFAKIHNGKDQKEVLIEEGGYPVLGTGGEFGRAKHFLYDKPSVLLGRKGTIDNPLFIEEPFWTVDTLFYTKISETVFPKFFYYLCKTIHFDYYQESSAVPSMTQDNLNNILLCWTSFEEQVEIAQYIDVKLKGIDSTIEKISLSIEKLKLYRQSIISEAVTGKIDVRDWKTTK
ncbi:restriction endonuclease subunit S [Halosquirtibacter laminarini]|uniref:Restriction endonuclease subunit S n=1 Tax=Halosquirtibacter laminarini TaxID=3374600 RepID=A0AC61NNL5_9BACT|nr:restriction endonuclease subunit S [Prolixibacteraceae bacterium]